MYQVFLSLKYFLKVSLSKWDKNDKATTSSAKQYVQLNKTKVDQHAVRTDK